MRRIDLIRQINWFIQQMKAENHPNATTLSKRFGINRQSALETTADGGLILRFPSFINPELIGEILRYGPEVVRRGEEE